MLGRNEQERESRLRSRTRRRMFWRTITGGLSGGGLVIALGALLGGWIITAPALVLFASLGGMMGAMTAIGNRKERSLQAGTGVSPVPLAPPQDQLPDQPIPVAMPARSSHATMRQQFESTEIIFCNDRTIIMTTDIGGVISRVVVATDSPYVETTITPSSVVTKTRQGNCPPSYNAVIGNAKGTHVTTTDIGGVETIRTDGAEVDIAITPGLVVVTEKQEAVQADDSPPSYASANLLLC